MENWRHGEGGLWDRARAARRRSVWLAMGSLALGVLTVGCTTTGGYPHSRFAVTGIAPGDVIAVALEKFSGEYSPGQEEKVAKCISKAIRETEPTVRIVPPEEFHGVAFADLTPAQLPAAKQQWIDLARDAAFRDRIAPLDIRYLIVVEGETKEDLKLKVASAPTPSGLPGAVLYLTGERRSDYSATMVDLKRPANVGEVTGFALGTTTISIPPVIVIIPPTERRACNALGEQVAGFLVGGDHRYWEKPPAETAGERSGEASAEPPVQEISPQSEQQQGPRQ